MTTAGDVIYGGVSGVSTRLAGAAGFLKSNGTTPSWSAVGLATTDVSGTLPIANGGTGAATAGAALTSLGALGTTSTAGGDLSGTFSNLQIVAGAISNADVNAAAAIAGTKILPNFGAQNVSTTGSATAGGGVVAGAASQFTVDGVGNITKINNIVTSFPAAQGAANTVLSNDGSGTLSWAAPSGGWAVAGNAGTTPGTDFVGTTDVKDLVFKTNSVENMRITAAGNVGIGTNNPGLKFEVLHNDADGGIILNHANAGNAKSEIRFSQNGVERWAIGNDFDRLGQQNFYIWDNDNAKPRFFIDPTGKVGIGNFTPAAPPSAQLEVAGAVKIVDGTQAAGRVLTSDVNGLASWQPAGAGSGWTLTGNAGTVDGTNFIGTTDNVNLSFKVNNVKSGLISTADDGGVYFGKVAGSNQMPLGIYNTGIGAYALWQNQVGQNNTAVGQGALLANNASNNTAVGQGALGQNTLGIGNTGVGAYALKLNNVVASRENTAVGYGALATNTSGFRNASLGFQADVSSGNLSNATAIGAYAYVTQSNSLILGSINGVNGASADTNVGIGTTAPSQRLHVIGNILASGTITPSDLRYKKSIEPLPNVLENVSRIRGVSYYYRKEEFPDLGFNTNKQIGVIAQEVEKVYPELGGY